MYASCPGCGTVVQDPGTSQPLVCPRCGAILPSRREQLSRAHSPQLRQLGAGTDPRGPHPPGTLPPSSGTPPAPHGRGEPPSGTPPGGPTPQDDPLREMWSSLRRLVHGSVLAGVLVMAAVVMVDLVILAWSHLPVSEAALRLDSASVLFIIAPDVVGETTWTGWQAFLLGAVLLTSGVALYRVRRSGRVAGMSGPGTALIAAVLALGGLVALAAGVQLVTGGHMFDPVTVPNVQVSPVALMLLQFSLLAQWHTIMVGAILMSAAVMVLKDGPAYLRMARGAISRGLVPPIRTDNTWIVVPRMYLAILAFYLMYYAILGAVSVEPEIPEFGKMPLWEQLHAFAEASVWEEVLSRALMLGLPLWLYHLYTGRLRAPLLRYLAGGGFPIDLAASVLVLVQALVFALAHVPGWDLWKLLPTTVSGVAFGYLFLKRGLWASILLHFTFDYLGMTVDVFGEWGLDIQGAFNTVFLLMVAVGFILLAHYMVILVVEGPGRARRALYGPDGGGGGKV